MWGRMVVVCWFYRNVEEERLRFNGNRILEKFFWDLMYIDFFWRIWLCRCLSIFFFEFFIVDFCMLGYFVFWFWMFCGFFWFEIIVCLYCWIYWVVFRFVFVINCVCIIFWYICFGLGCGFRVRGRFYFVYFMLLFV